jgi:hypothetical protein
MYYLIAVYPHLSGRGADKERINTKHVALTTPWVPDLGSLNYWFDCRDCSLNPFYRFRFSDYFAYFKYIRTKTSTYEA